MLVSLILALGYYSGRYMSGTDSRVRFVDMLASGTTGSIGVDSDVFFINEES
jgi:hypothetical protein